ncbi:MAG TPA: hypothetical protein VIL49_17980 [Capillimicrobium sp.]|jgi:hypothetical protein
MGGRAVLLAMLAAVALGGAAPASALPGDDPFGPVAPEDGAVLAPSADGIPVSFTCPVYRTFTAGEGFTLFGGPSDYGVSFATAPDLGSDGRLLETNVVALDEGHTSNAVPEGQCQSVFAASGSIGERPQERPGTYFWQVWRLCTGCDGSYETGPVRRLTIRLAARPELRLPRRAFAGYPVALPVDVPGAPDGAEVTVQRRAGGAWRRAGAGSAFDEAAEAIVTLPRGEQTLRAVVASGADTVSGDERVLRVRAAKRWSTTRADDGAYSGRSGVRLRVGGGGRTVESFEADVAMLCPGLVAGQLTTQFGQSSVRRVRIAPDGTFIAAARLASDTSTLVRGRVRDGRATGTAQLSLGTCSGTMRFSADRAG